MKPVILLTLTNFLPGYNSGGPLRTILNLIVELGDEFDFKILTSDRDLGDNVPYAGVTTNEWVNVDGVQVYYMSPDTQNLNGISAAINSTEYDVLYLNSFFSPLASIWPLLASKLGRLPKRPIILAPRGEFSTGALRLKTLKKKLFLAAAGALRLHSDVQWQASTAHEMADIEKVMGTKVRTRITIASDLAAAQQTASSKPLSNENAVLRMVFLSRISPMKNLVFALRVIRQVKVAIQFDIYGPIEDEKHWKSCQEVISEMPQNCTVSYIGTVDPAKVVETLSEYDLFFLPTMGENYGHVIAESFLAGTPVLISNNTPWRDLKSQGIGFDLDLSEPSAFVGVIEAHSRLGPQAKAELEKRVLSYARDNVRNSADIEANRRLFLDLLPKDR